MKHLVIRHFGPLRNASVDIDQVNLIIGLQSSGKSCVLKIACYCAWVEKRIELAQSAEEYKNSTKFFTELLSYYKMQSYLAPDTYIEYTTKYMTFSYSQENKRFSFKWGNSRWNYKRAKVSYVPSDRNLVAAIPAWSKLSLEYDNLLDFMGDWNVARKQLKTEENILGLGISYVFDPLTNSDQLKLKNGNMIRLTESSSGVQSLTPLVVHLDYLRKSLSFPKGNFPLSYEEREARKSLLSAIYRKTNKTMDSHAAGIVKSIEGVDFMFSDEKEAKMFVTRAHNFLDNEHNEIFLEEPEDNLFPITQCQLVNWLLDSVVDSKREDVLFVATHSPYVLDQMLKIRPPKMNVYFTYPVSEEGLYDVRSLSEEETSEVYDNGVDLFLNFEAYV